MFLEYNVINNKSRHKILDERTWSINFKRTFVDECTDLKDIYLEEHSVEDVCEFSLGNLVQLEVVNRVQEYTHNGNRINAYVANEYDIDEHKN